METRKPTDICLLCNLLPADQTGSHFTPAGLLKKVIGPRNYEDAYQIDAYKATTANYKGRSNLSNTNPAIQPHMHAMDHVFCSSCEKRLGELENACNPVLNKLVDDLVIDKVPINRTANHNKYAALKINPHVLSVYMYSVIYRQCLQQQLLNGTAVVSAAFQEKLRKLINAEADKGVKGIAMNPGLAEYPPMNLLTTYHRGDTSANYANPHPLITNPDVFFLGNFIGLIWPELGVEDAFEKRTAIPLNITGADLTNTFTGQPLIGILSETQWKRIYKNYVDNTVDVYMNTMITRLMLKRGYTYNYAGWLLH